MSLRRWDPFAELMSMREMMDRLFEEGFGRPRSTIAQRAGPMLLPVDLYETGDAYIVKASIPGAKPDDVNISCSGNSVSIRAEVKEDESVQPDSYLYQERAYGTFARDITLPSQVQTDKADAKFETGVLTLTVPKSEEVKPKQIKVKS